MTRADLEDLRGIRKYIIAEKTHLRNIHADMNAIRSPALYYDGSRSRRGVSVVEKYATESATVERVIENAIAEYEKKLVDAESWIDANVKGLEKKMFFKLRFVEGLSYIEISRRMTDFGYYSDNNVRVQVMREMRRLGID